GGVDGGHETEYIPPLEMDDGTAGSVRRDRGEEVDVSSDAREVAEAPHRPGVPTPFVVDLVGGRRDDGVQVAAVGGKGVQLGRLAGIEGVRVPAAFCVTTGAYRRALAEVPSYAADLDQLATLGADDH